MRNVGSRGLCCVLVLCSGMALAQSNSGWWSQNRSGDAAATEPATAASPANEVPAVPPPVTHEQPVPAPLPTPLPTPVASPALPLSQTRFDCVEVARFEVNDGLITSKEDARAAMIPAERLAEIQRSVAGNIPGKIAGMRAALAGATTGCPDPQRTVLLTGRIVDFKKGNQALRYFVGFGAGAQKFSVMARAVRKSDGALLAEEDVTDRKVGGWIGGDADKGLDDFGEKVATFVKRALPATR